MDSILTTDERALLQAALASEVLQPYAVVLLAKEALERGDEVGAIRRLLVDVDKFFCIHRPLSKLLMRKRLDLLQAA